MAINPRRIATAKSRTRVQGVSTQQIVKPGPAVLKRLIVSNADAAAQTLTLADGATTLLVIRVPIGQTLSLPLDLEMTTDLRVTPSSVNLDALILYD